MSKCSYQYYRPALKITFLVTVCNSDLTLLSIRTDLEHCNEALCRVFFSF